MNDLKFCMHCRWFRRRWMEPATYAKCGHARAARFSSDQYVDASKPAQHFCGTMRERECGPDGTFVGAENGGRMTCRN